MDRTEPNRRGLRDAIADMDAIVDACRASGHRAGLFASMYRSVTIQIDEAVRGGGFFDDDERLERFAVVFADRYIDAFRAHEAGLPTTASWQTAFRYADKPRGRMILQHLMLGMNAHINLDLGVAAAQSTTPLEDIEADFVRVNEILFGMVDELEGRLGEVSPRIAFLDRIGGSADEWFMRTGIRAARVLAWEFAKDLSEADVDQRDAVIAERDDDTARLARLIGSGWSPLHLAGRFIAAAERNQVAAAIDVLSEQRADLDRAAGRAADAMAAPAPKPEDLPARRRARRLR